MTYTFVGKYKDPVRNMDFYHCLPSTGRLMLHVFYNKPKSRLRTALTTQNTIENNRTISHAQNTAALQPNVFVTGRHRLLVTYNRQSAFPIAKTLPRSTANSSVSISTIVMFRENCKMHCDENQIPYLRAPLIRIQYIFLGKE